MRDLGDVPRPRVWFEDVPDNVRRSLSGLAGGYEEWGGAGDNFHPADWDLVVTFGTDATYRSSNHLYVLSFGAEHAAVQRQHDSPFGHVRVSLDYLGETHSRSRFVSEDESSLPSGWRRLLTDTVVDQLPDGAKRYWIGGTTVGCTHLVTVGRGHPSGPAALLVERTPKPAGLLLLLPQETTDHGAWLIALIELLRTRDPSAFPAPPDWRKSRDWAPVGLQAALDASSSIADERQRALADYDRRERAAAESVSRQIDLAAKGPHRLLNSQGEDLVAAVVVALISFGFRVRNMDEELEPGHTKMEDLRVGDPDAPGWELIAEVKGYSKGAKATDVQQILQRPMWAYIEEMGSRPSGVWHIVNAFSGTHPATRPLMLQDDPAILQLSDADGALIDTRDLFKAHKAVQSGDVTAEEVRRSMRSARGRWQFDRPAVNSPTGDE